MKKVICVDAKGYGFVTEQKEYEVIDDSGDYYMIRNDNGSKADLLKSRFRPVPEAEYQYGQEVCIWGSDKKRKYIAPSSFNSPYHLIEVKDGCTTSIEYLKLSDIRPVQSMREKVKELLEICGASNIDKTTNQLQSLFNLITTLRSRVKELEESKFTRLDLERAHIAGWNNIDFEDWYQSELPPTK